MGGAPVRRDGGTIRHFGTRSTLLTAPSSGIPRIGPRTSRFRPMIEFAGPGTSTCVDAEERSVAQAQSDRLDCTMTEESKPVEVSRRIKAPPALIFEILANLQRHMDFDGSDMLRGAVFNRPISEVGDTFIMKMNRHGRGLPHAQLCSGVRARSPHILGTCSGRPLYGWR